MHVVCKEHVEHAIDRFVDEFEEAPDIVDLSVTHFAAWDPPPTCELCDKEAEYLIV